jgi:hypothetical protein
MAAVSVLTKPVTGQLAVIVLVVEVSAVDVEVVVVSVAMVAVTMAAVSVVATPLIVAVPAHMTTAAAADTK